MSFKDEETVVVATDIRSVAGCLKNAYHVTALQNAADCNDCMRLLARGFMSVFGIKSHIDFGSID